MATAWKESMNTGKSETAALQFCGQTPSRRFSMHKDESHNIYAAFYQVWDFFLYTQKWLLWVSQQPEGDFPSRNSVPIE